MRYLKMFITLFFVLAGFIETIFGFQSAASAKNASVPLADTSHLNVSYDYQQKNTVRQWNLHVFHSAEEGAGDQRVKFKLYDEKNNQLGENCSVQMDGLVYEDGWFVEKEFSHSKKETYFFNLPLDVENIHLRIQLDERIKTLSQSSDSESNKRKTDSVEIKANTLTEKMSGPYALSVKKATKETTTSQSLYSDTSSLSANSDEPESLMYQSNYNNKMPIYSPPNETGTYPAVAWSPSGQETVVRNHQGGRENEIGWDGNTGWNVANDDRTKSYIHYGVAKDNSSIALRKYAKATKSNDLFDMRLNVRGDIYYDPGIDIVFLLDNSGSMKNQINGQGKKKKESAVNALRTLTTELAKISIGDNIRIGAHIFSDYKIRYDYPPNPQAPWPDEMINHPLSNDPKVWSKMVTKFEELPPEGQTFTQRALMQASDIFKQASGANDRKKIMFVLTDGAPNESFKPIEKNSIPSVNNQIYLDNLHVQNWDAKVNGKYKLGDIYSAERSKTKFYNPFYVNGNNLYKLTSHISTTNSTAYDLKNQNIEIHTLAVNIMRSTAAGYQDHTLTELTTGLARMSTKKANVSTNYDEDYFFNHVDNVDNLVEDLKEWYNTVVRTVDKGIITDPLGDMVELEGKPTISVTDENGDPITLDPPPTVNVTTVNNRKQINVSGITLTKGQELQVDYQVRLKTGNSDFKKGVWYQTNGRTTLTPTPESSEDQLDFGVPSVQIEKEKTFSIPVKKVWSDTQNSTSNYWQLRPAKLSVVLQKQSGSNWLDLQTKELTGPNWEGSFEKVQVEPNAVYRVIEKVDNKNKIPGYESPVYSRTTFTKEQLADETLTITNKLMLTNFEFHKYTHDGQTPFSKDKPVFSISKKGTNPALMVTNKTPDNNGKVVFAGLPMGEYTLQETKVPTGYKKKADLDFKVVEKANGTGLEVKINDSTNPLKITNELKDFTLKVLKLNTNGNALEGAAFRLTGPNQYDQKITTGSTFSFTGLKPGTYSLTETAAPKNYTGLSEKVTINIRNDGTVTFSENPMIEGSGGLSGTNEITLKVKNSRVGVLPSTGGKGTGKNLLVLLVISGGVVLSGGVYAVLRKRKSSD